MTHYGRYILFVLILSKISSSWSISQCRKQEARPEDCSLEVFAIIDCTVPELQKDRPIEFSAEEYDKFCLKCWRIKAEIRSRQEISENTFSLFPDSIQELHITDVLYLKIEENSFQKFGDLLNLHLSYSTIDSLPTHLFNYTPNLVSLRIRYCNLKNIGEHQFDRLQKLKKLDLAGNSMRVLPQNWTKGLGSLEYLNLGMNKLTTLKEGIFQGMTQLKFLSLYDNKITTIIDHPFEDLRELEELELNSNQIRNLPNDWYRGLDNLKELLLVDNHLTVIRKEMFQGLTKLRRLSLDFNEIIKIEPVTFKQLTSLTNLGTASSGDMESDNIIEELRSMKNLKELYVSPPSLECKTLRSILELSKNHSIFVAARNEGQCRGNNSKARMSLDDFSLDFVV